MDFNVKKFAADAATAFNRAVQYTEEKLGTSEKTELDAHFENLVQRADKTKLWTEKILARTEGVLTPNPNNRVEDYLFEKLEKKSRDRLSNMEQLGLDLMEAGSDFGPGTAYGSSLIKVGYAEQRLGQADRDFVQKAARNFMQPLKKFLEGDMRTIMKERKILENKRLDLDACKSRLRKARTMESQRTAERDLHVAQSEFDRQSEITKLLLEGVSSAHASHLKCLHDFVEAQMTYYVQCHQYMTDLQKELSSASFGASVGAMPSDPGLFSIDASPSTSPVCEKPERSKKARVLYDYDATNPKELSLLADEVVMVHCDPGLGSDWMMAERGLQKGHVPAAYLELLN